MKALIVYDSVFGNTEKIAQVIGEAIGGQVRRASHVNPADLKGFDFLIVGSPTHGGWYTPEIQSWLKALPALEGANAAMFDTRTVSKIGALLFGFAAHRIARRLERNGGKLLASPEGFVVLGIQGPLKDGELERAAEWAKQLLLYSQERMA